MDISVIDSTKVSTKNGLLIGSESAPIKLIEFINVRCPFCKKWFEESYELLTNQVNDGKLQRVIKLFDKEKESLQRGNVMHRYVDYAHPVDGLASIAKMFETQDQWAKLSLDEVALFAENTLQLSKKDNLAMTQAVISEANAANIKFVPTNIIGTQIFDESITKDSLLAFLTK